MNKAILIIDMPRHCNECDVICTKYYATSLKKGDGEIVIKPSDCPLREVLEKQVHHSSDSTFLRGAKSGYNYCLYEILKGSEEDG